MTKLDVWQKVSATTIWTLFIVVSCLIVLNGCDTIGNLLGPTPAGTSVEINDNSGEVAISITDEDVAVDIGDGTGDVVIDILGGGCCDEADTAVEKCWSTPSGTYIGEGDECTECLAGGTCSTTEPSE